ncbi:MetQ/NlpA family ABC transporter substrate-binding protein, partial [Francisella tularensis subsp. holarctica]|uniref:MetQ/NlpA family ABC transporter substrate-binding protein n=1 Tax=Francisella tularensis TaxID=263 RepID=UPI002381B93C
DNIVRNPKHLNILALQADQIPNYLEVVALGIINTDYLSKAGLTHKDALFVEPTDSPFTNLLAANSDQKDSTKLNEYVLAFQSPA